MSAMLDWWRHRRATRDADALADHREWEATLDPPPPMTGPAWAATRPGTATLLARWSDTFVPYRVGDPWDGAVAEARQVLDLVNDAAGAELLTSADMRAWNNAMTVLNQDRDRREAAALAAREDEIRRVAARRDDAARRAVTRHRATATRRTRVPALTRRQWRTDRKANTP